MSLILNFSEVSKNYGALGTAINAVSFSLNEGEFTALAGPSGSGKTTILNLAAGLDRPSEGKIEVLGKTISRLDASSLSRFRRESCGFIFQSYNLFPVLTALENVEYPLALRRVKTRERRRRALAALAEVGLEKYTRRFPRELSGGQQQRVAVARAIVTEPKIIFADEPTANLDSASTSLLLDLFSALNRDKHITFLFSSHDSRVLACAKRVLSVRDGRIEVG